MYIVEDIWICRAKFNNISQHLEFPDSAQGKKGMMMFFEIA